MRLGKALATGVAEEEDRTQDDGLRVPEAVEEPETSVPEEVTAGR
ncbi:hypothetical protein [Streptomyces sp. Tue6028]